MALCSWWNDLELVELTTPMGLGFIHTEETLRGLQKSFQADPEKSERFYMIQNQGSYVGYYSLMIDPPHALLKTEKTSWLGLMIGERDCWGKGVAVEAMTHFEEVSRKLGAKRIELGVFDFNDRAKNFYLKMGYQEIGRIPEFTFYQNQWWDDIRMEKIFTA